MNTTINAFKKRVAVVAVVAMRLLMSFNVAPVSAQGVPPSLNAEAQKVVKQYWDGVLTKCGDFYYTAKTSFDKIVYITQINGKVSFGSVRASHISTAEKLNDGVEWRGTADMDIRGGDLERMGRVERFGAFPMPLPSGQTGSGVSASVLIQWGQWLRPTGSSDEQSLHEEIGISKEGGRWSVYRSSEADDSFVQRKLSCAAVTGQLPAPAGGLYVTQ